MSFNTHSLDLEASSSQYANITDGSQTGLDIAGDHTVECWVNFESLPASGDSMYLISKSNSGDNNRSYAYYLNNNGGTLNIRAEISDDGTNRDMISWNWTPSTSTWYYLAITCDVSNAAATEFELFRGDQSTSPASQGNGSVVSDDSATSIFNGTANFNIGAVNNTAGSFLDGKIDEVRISDVVRSSAYLSSNYKTQVNIDSDHVEIWRFNNGVSGVSGGNTLSLGGSAGYSTDVPFPGFDSSTNGSFFLSS